MSELLANPRGCLSLAERNSSAAELMAPQETTTRSAEYVSRLPLRSTSTPFISRPDESVSSLHQRICQQGHVRILDCFVHAHNLRVGLGTHKASESVAGVAANATTLLRIFFVEHDPDRNVEGLQAGTRKVIRQLLNTGLMAHGRPRIGSFSWRLRRIFSAIAVHLIKIFGLRVIGLQIVIADRPRRRDSAVVS